MRRRTLLAAAPAVALLPTAGLAQSAKPAPKGDPALPPAWDKDSERFLRPDVHAGDRPVGASFASRTAAYGLSGAVGTAHPLATQAGIDMLKRGGSAVDAAIATNACLGLLEPTANGIGGDAYAMIWDPKAKKVVGLAGSGKSPRALDLATVRSRATGGAIPAYGAIAVSVPGTVDAWWTMHQRYGKLPWKELFEPVIAHAEAGAPVPDMIAYYIRRSLAGFRQPGRGIEEVDNALRTYGMADGKGPQAGQVFRNPDLARTFRLIAEGGRDVFYDGEIARTIDAYFRRIGGWLRREDLAAHRSEWIEPHRTSYRGTDVYALGANTQGIATLQMLNILENFDLKGAGFQSALSIHLQAEAKRLAYEDRARYYADPHFSNVPVEWLISKDYAAERARLIRPDPRRYHLFQRRRQGRHDGVDDPVELPRHGIGSRRRRPRFHVPGSRAIVQPAGWPPEYLRPRQAPVPDDHPRFRRAWRHAVDELRGDGRRHAAAGADADHGQPHRLRPRNPGRRRFAALAP